MSAPPIPVHMLIPALPFPALCVEAVGSRVTCLPAPTDTDQDWLVLVGESVSIAEINDPLVSKGWELGGSLSADVRCPAATGDTFWSYTLGDHNLIITQSRDFYRQFMAATHVAKHLNLLKKDDRIILFQAVLYGACA